MMREIVDELWDTVVAHREFITANGELRRRREFRLREELRGHGLFAVGRRSVEDEPVGQGHALAWLFRLTLQSGRDRAAGSEDFLRV